MPAYKLRAERLWRKTGRTLQASLRYLRLVVSEFSVTFVLILALLATGTILFHRCPMNDLGGRPPDDGQVSKRRDAQGILPAAGRGPEYARRVFDLINAELQDHLFQIDG